MAMMDIKIWRRMNGKALLLLMNIVSAVALIYEGYNQGVYGSISETPGFIDMAAIGYDGVVTNSTKQGGLGAAYYFGGLLGCFVGGWVGDKIGRKRGTLSGTGIALVGAALQAGSVNSDMFVCARVVAGLGIGFLNSVVPPWVSELSPAHERGANFSLVFVANYVGIVIAYWINFSVGGGSGASPEFQWRFPLGFMIVPLLIVGAILPFLPESPRWLMANDRRDEAVEILRKIRGGDADGPLLATELTMLDAIVHASSHPRNRLANIVLGGRHSGKLHLGRRAVAGFLLQQIQQWTGILVVASWAGTIFTLAGFEPYAASWMSGVLNTIGIPGTAAAALVIDRMGRIRSLLVSFAAQAVSLFLLGALIKTSQDNTGELSDTLGKAAVAFAFLFLWFFTMFGIVPVWIYGTEIWPQEVRSKGYGFTICGWAVGCGVTTFVIPIMLDRLGWGTFIFFGAMNCVCAPVVWLFYPETAGRSLEEVNLLFTSESLLVSRNMVQYRRRVDGAGGDIAVAARQLLDEVEGARVDVFIDDGMKSDEK